MLPCFHVTSTIQTGWRRATAIRAQLEAKKFGNWLFRFVAYYNPLKSHKTAKGFFGKAWRKQAEIWKCLEKNLGGWQTRPGGARFAVHEPQRGLAKP
jgi:hypothetical protein